MKDFPGRGPRLWSAHQTFPGTRVGQAIMGLNETNSKCCKKILKTSPPPIPPLSEGEGQSGGAKGTRGEVLWPPEKFLWPFKSKAENDFQKKFMHLLGNL